MYRKQFRHPIITPGHKGASHILTANATSVSVAIPAGFDEVFFRVQAPVNLSAVPANMFVRPNGLTTNQGCQVTQTTSGVVIGSHQVSWFFAISAEADLRKFAGVGRIVCRTGLPRDFSSEGVARNSSGSMVSRHVRAAGFWNDDSTPLTSLVFLGDVASSLGIGTKVWVWGERWGF